MAKKRGKALELGVALAHERLEALK